MPRAGRRSASVLTWVARTLVHASWMTVVGLVLVLQLQTGVLVEPDQTGPDTSSVGDRLTQDQLLDLRVADVMRRQAEAGLVCRRQAREGELPVRIIQHAAVDRRSQASGWRTTRAYDVDTAFAQADLGGDGTAATHWSDAFCYR